MTFYFSAQIIDFSKVRVCDPAMDTCGISCNNNTRRRRAIVNLPPEGTLAARTIGPILVKRT